MVYSPMVDCTPCIPARGPSWICVQANLLLTYWWHVIPFLTCYWLFCGAISLKPHREIQQTTSTVQSNACCQITSNKLVAGRHVVGPNTHREGNVDWILIFIVSADHDSCAFSLDLHRHCLVAARMGIQAQANVTIIGSANAQVQEHLWAMMCTLHGANRLNTMKPFSK